MLQWIYAMMHISLCSIFNYLWDLHILYHCDCNNLLYNLTNNVRGFPFLHFLSNTRYLLSFDHSHSSKWYLIVLSICISLVISNVEHLCMSLLTLCACFLWKNVYSELLPIFKKIFKNLLISRQRGREGKRGWETSRCGCLSCALY